MCYPSSCPRSYNPFLDAFVILDSALPDVSLHFQASYMDSFFPHREMTCDLVFILTVHWEMLHFI